MIYEVTNNLTGHTRGFTDHAEATQYAINVAQQTQCPTEVRTLPTLCDTCGMPIEPLATDKSTDDQELWAHSDSDTADHPATPAP